MQDKAQLKQEIESKLADGILASVNGVISERSAHYAAHPARRLAPQSVASVIDKYKYMNAGIVGALNLIPGPFGMLATIPELIAVMRNQLAMIYDIGAAHGQEKAITPELLVGIFASATMGGGLGLLVMQGQKVLVRRTSLRMLQKLIAKLAGDITQRALKKMLAKWLPGIGAVFMATWAGYTTKRLGDKAAEVFSKTVEVCPTHTLDTETDPNPNTTPNTTTDTNTPADDTQRRLRRQSYALCLVNLMHADGHIHAREVEFIQIITARTAFPPDEAAHIQALANQAAIYPIQFDLLRDPSTSLPLLLDMVALAYRDGELHPNERAYILKVGTRLGYEEPALLDMIDLSPTLARSSP